MRYGKVRDSKEKFNIVWLILYSLTFEAPTPQNGQTHSNNSSAAANGLCVFDHFVELKGYNNKE